jgi:hypothetical protein
VAPREKALPKRTFWARMVGRRVARVKRRRVLVIIVDVDWNR